MKLMTLTGFSGEDKKRQMRLERLVCVFFVLETEIWFSAFIFNLSPFSWECKTSQVTYVTMVPRVGNETLRPLGVATGNAHSVTRSEDTYEKKNTTCWPATAHDVTTGVPQYKCRREDTSSASSSEACVRSMAQSPGDAVSRSPLGEPWLHT